MTLRNVFSLVLVGQMLFAQQAPKALEAKVAAPDPQWDRLYPNEKILEFMRGYAKAYPEWVKLESIGKTGFGGDTWLLTITNPKTGPAESKPAVYIDGATHANEVQGTEVCTYTIGFLLKNYGKLPG